MGRLAAGHDRARLVADHLDAREAQRPDRSRPEQYTQGVPREVVGAGGCDSSGVAPRVPQAQPTMGSPAEGSLVRGDRMDTLPVGDGDDLLEQVYGTGLDGRLRQDLSLLTPETLITPNERFFIRTRRPDLMNMERPWTVRVHGLVEHPREIPLAELLPRARPMGVHLLECSASARGGLISAARWSGIPMGEVLRDIRFKAGGQRVLVSGFDRHSEFDLDYDERGANWVFKAEELEAAGAFLATEMNGVPLPEDHGFPLRLVVPGWYGCTCIKWVDEIRIVDDDEPATNHMRDYASRTHQDGKPERARDFVPARIDLAAMAVRVERWRVGGELVHRVVGILWGGENTTHALVIRFRPDSAFEPVDEYVHETTKTWMLWSKTWRPRHPGAYDIELAIDDPRIRTRRLDAGYYTRSVTIHEV